MRLPPVRGRAVPLPVRARLADHGAAGAARAARRRPRDARRAGRAPGRPRRRADRRRSRARSGTSSAPLRRRRSSRPGWPADGRVRLLRHGGRDVLVPRAQRARARVGRADGARAAALARALAGRRRRPRAPRHPPVGARPAGLARHDRRRRGRRRRRLRARGRHEPGAAAGRHRHAGRGAWPRSARLSALRATRRGHGVPTRCTRGWRSLPVETMALEAGDVLVGGAGSQLGWLLWAERRRRGRPAVRAGHPHVVRIAHAVLGRPELLRVDAYHRGSVWPFDSWLGWGGLRRGGPAA